MLDLTAKCERLEEVVADQIGRHERSFDEVVAQRDKAVAVLETCGRCICVCGQTCAAALAEIRKEGQDDATG